MRACLEPEERGPAASLVYIYIYIYITCFLGNESLFRTRRESGPAASLVYIYIYIYIMFFRE